MEAEILQVAETGLCDLRDAGIPICDADVCCGTTGQTVQQASYTACHPIPRRHQTLIRSTLNTRKKQFSGFICRTVHYITHESPVVTLCTSRVDIEKFYIYPTEFFYVF
jgi:hypothetical protein